MSNRYLEELQELAYLYRLQTSYQDGMGVHRRAPPETIFQVLRALGAPVENFSDIPEALTKRKQELSTRFVEPVLVGASDSPFSIPFCIPSTAVDGSIRVKVELENGEKLTQERRLQELAIEREDRVEETVYQRRILEIPPAIPLGYHRVKLETPSRTGKALLIVAPATAWLPDRLRGSWGAFVPLYSLRSERNWGAGDFTDLLYFRKWLEEKGGQFVGTLPLLASFLDLPFDPSPYAPLSRFFWNEFYIDPTGTPEWAQCEEARQIYHSSQFQTELQTQRQDPLVGYRPQMRLKREILQQLADFFFAGETGRRNGFESFRSGSPHLETYACFRATQERMQKPWTAWPDRMRDGILQPGDYDERARNYHLYAQWIAEQQLKTAFQSVDLRRAGLYLDLPLGVHPDGYDVWSQQSLFALGISGGAPPDGFFTLGQNWGFPPLHPEQIRLQEYRYVRQSLRHLLKCCDLLRIDHVMGFQRLYWVPAGTPATDGLYAHYYPEELFAILTLESHRRQCVIVGEDLGTVPPELRRMMTERQICRMYVGQFEVWADRRKPFSPVPSAVVASLNTHDTATFSSFWSGLDIEDRQKSGLLSEQEAQQERSHRLALREALMDYFGLEGEPEDPAIQRSILKGWLRYLSHSEAAFVMVNLEDLWLETHPQNVPGTASERPNWRKKLNYSLEDFCKVPGLLDTLEEINSKRRGNSS